MNQNVINFFKRNPEAQVCHLVTSTCFHSAKVASSYQKNMGAKKVYVTLRSEYDAWLAGKQKVDTDMIVTTQEVLETNTDKEDQ